MKRSGRITRSLLLVLGLATVLTLVAPAMAGATGGIGGSSWVPPAGPPASLVRPSPRAESVASDGPVQIIHVSQPASLAGRPLDLPVAVTSDCNSIFCTITVQALYRAPDGTQRTVSASGSGPYFATVLQIPGQDVRRPSFSYWLQARVVYCTFFHCYENGSARMPDVGAFHVMVA